MDEPDLELERIRQKKMSKLQITKLTNIDTLVLKQTGGKDFFIAAPDSIVISPGSLAFILTFMVMNGFLSPKVLEGVLEEYYTS